MTRKLKALTVAGLAGLSLAGAGCENHDAEQALVTCRNDVTGLRTNLANQNAVIKDLRARLTKAQGNPAEVAKDDDAAQIAKADGAREHKTKTAETRKLDSGK